MIVEVHHAPDQLAFSRNVDRLAEAFAQGRYTYVADVVVEPAETTAMLDVAYERTNSIDDHWSKNEGVTMHVQHARSTSVADVIVIDGAAHVVCGVGFLPVSVALPVR